MKKIKGNIRAFKLVVKLFLVFCLGSVAFISFLPVLETDDWVYARPDEKIAILSVAFLISLSIELFIYSRFYRQWRLFFLNFAIAHFASFFASIGGVIAAISGLEYVAIGFIGVWFPIAYFCQYHLIYVEAIELEVKELREKVSLFDKEKAAINEKINRIKTQIDNKGRFGN